LRHAPNTAGMMYPVSVSATVQRITGLYTRGQYAQRGDENKRQDEKLNSSKTPYTVSAGNFLTLFRWCVCALNVNFFYKSFVPITVLCAPSLTYSSILTAGTEELLLIYAIIMCSTYSLTTSMCSAPQPLYIFVKVSHSYWIGGDDDEDEVQCYKTL